MRQRYPGRRTLLSLLAFSSLISALAGNIPQYKVSKGDASAKYSGFPDGTVIPCKWADGNYVLLPNGATDPNVGTSAGYPIEFSFRFGGKTVDRFLPTNNGDIYLGKDNVTYGDDCFCVSMSPVKHGLKAGEISYKVTGNEGNRVLVLQWKNATINQSSGYVGKYNLQLRFHEKDGKIEMAFKELETPDTGNGFNTSIHGWDERDALLLTASGLDKAVSVSQSYTADMLNPASYIKWDKDDYDMGYSPVFVFTPENEATAPVSAPSGLKVTQNGTNLEISCVRGADSDATAILVSTKPFTDADMPVDGETFRASYLDGNGSQKFPVKVGDSYPVYYGNDENISAIFQGVEQGTVYYIRAISANGYPAWNRADFAEMSYSSSQAAPSSLEAEAAGTATIKVRCTADNPVIIASTDKPVSGYGKGYVGQFGTPAANAAVGDIIEGGGKVVYVGEAGKSVDIEAAPNTLTYLRAWTVKDGRLSSTAVDCAAVPTVSYPFAPAIENYPQGILLQGWESLPAGQNQFIPLPRNDGADFAVRATSANGERVILRTPSLPLDRPLKVTFDWAMETVRASEASDDSGSIELPKGNKPGEFGSGSLDLSVGGTAYRSVNSYNGTMTLYASDEYVTGSSTFENFTAEIPAGAGNGSIEISFAGDKGNTSILYIRNILVEATGENPVAPSEAPTSLAVDEDRDGFLYISCVKGSDAAYTALLLSESPITAADLPADGKTPAVGSKNGNATVLYFGNDEKVEYVTDTQIFIAGFDTPYYIAALSAGENLLFNRTDMAQAEYRTLPDFGAPASLSAEYDSTDNAVDIAATKHENAESTLILVSTEPFDGKPEDGHSYTTGESLGNAVVAYSGTDADIAVSHPLTGNPEKVTVTAYSCNPRGWYSSQKKQETISTINVGIESVLADVDLRDAEIFNIAGVRLNVIDIKELPAGVYIINGKKVVIR